MARFVAALRTIVWTPVFYLLTACLVIVAGIALIFSRSAFFAVVSRWGWLQRGCAYWLLGQRVEMEGDLPTGAVFLVMKHESMFETIDLPYLLRRPAIFAKRELFSIPLWGRLASIYGLIPIDRDAGASALRAMRKAALDTIAAGRPLVLFPEGTRVAHGAAPSIRAGFAGLYKMLNLPVIPAAVDSGRLRDGWIRLPGTIRYRFGAPIPPGLPREEAETLAWRGINALNAPDATVATE